MSVATNGVGRDGHAHAASVLGRNKGAPLYSGLEERAEYPAASRLAPSGKLMGATWELQLEGERRDAHCPG